MTGPIANFESVAGLPESSMKTGPARLVVGKVFRVVKAANAAEGDPRPNPLMSRNRPDNLNLLVTVHCRPDGS